MCQICYIDMIGNYAVKIVRISLKVFKTKLRSSLCTSKKKTDLIQNW